MPASHDSFLAAPALSRRLLLRSAAAATGMGLLGSSASGILAASHPLAPRPSHAAARAKRVILFFMTGGVSHVDSFDPKPQLTQDDGKKRNDTGGRPLKKSPWTASPRGQSGLLTTNLFPHISSVIDDLCLIRSMRGDHGDHFEATLHMHTGSNGSALPGIGAWLSYGLGTENPNLPSHIVFAEHEPYAGSQAWDSNFLPAYHQGVRVTPGSQPIPNLRPQTATAGIQDGEIEFLQNLNRRHQTARTEQSELAARMLSFETARSMQKLAPDLFDLTAENDATLEQYGMKRGDNRSFAWQCLMARRMAENGVRFIELIDRGAGGNWDAHGDIMTHAPLAKNIDQPIAALVRDLKQRGMLDETLIVWCTEFGRTPQQDSSPKGRGHHRHAFTCWLAGGGVKGGHAYGNSDEHGVQVAENAVSIHDFHATILHILGLDHEKLTFPYSGLNQRLTGVHGNVIQDILA